MYFKKCLKEVLSMVTSYRETTYFGLFSVGVVVYMRLVTHKGKKLVLGSGGMA